MLLLFAVNHSAVSHCDACTSNSHGVRRKSNVPVNFDAYKNWRSQHSSPSHSNDISTAAALSSNSHNETAALGGIPPATEAASTTEPPAPYPNSFSQIVELITTGQPIPGIKEVPDTLLSGQETQTTTARRKKPWEKDEAGSADRIVRTET